MTDSTDWMESYFSLENLPDHPGEQAYLVYTYLAPSPETDGPDKFLFIPIRVVNSQTAAVNLCQQLVDENREIFYHPMNRWMCLGETSTEKMTIVDELTKTDHRRQRKKKQLDQKRRETDEDIRQEELALRDNTSIESYYYDWVCAVQDQIYMESIQQQLNEIRAAYQDRLKSIREKQAKNPQLAKEWMEVFRNRLKKRGEENQAEAIIERARVIQESDL